MSISKKIDVDRKIEEYPNKIRRIKKRKRSMPAAGVEPATL